MAAGDAGGGRDRPVQVAVVQLRHHYRLHEGRFAHTGAAGDQNVPVLGEDGHESIQVFFGGLEPWRVRLVVFQPGCEFSALDAFATIRRLGERVFRRLFQE